MSIIEEIENELAIYCDDHVDVERIDNDCFIEMEDCMCTSTDDIKPIIEDINQFDMVVISIDIEEGICGPKLNIYAKMCCILCIDDLY